MKLDITSLYYNGDTKSAGNTASWGTALGQERPGYRISVEGGQDLVDFIQKNHFDFNPSKNPNHRANIKKLDVKRIIASGVFNVIYINDVQFEGPFFLLVIEETSGSHTGRKNLKYNNKIEVDGDSNEQFYNKISNYFGIQSCWFAQEIFVKNDQLHISIIQVSEDAILYQDAQIRKIHWESFLNEFSDVKLLFKEYLTDVHGVKNISTANEYIKFMPRIEEWFIENKLCDKGYQIWNIRNENSRINDRLKSDFKTIWADLNREKSGWYGTPWNRWLEFTGWYYKKIEKSSVSINCDIVKLFFNDINLANVNFTELLIIRYVTSLFTKPFVILNGLTGSGKTKLAQTFAIWLSDNNSQYAVVPVGADWTNREPLLGYPNSLKLNHYVTPDSGVLDILLSASNNYLENNCNITECKPYFLILDEMNLSHVERYFADFLSAMESGDNIKLYSGSERFSEFDVDDNPILSSRIPPEIILPQNLFIIGTVNIDETTYMFSPKVLDRANTIEFRVSKEEMASFYQNVQPINTKVLVAKGKDFAKDFMAVVAGEGISFNSKEHKDTFLEIFETLQSAGAEFGYRTANEMVRLVSYLRYFRMSPDEALDIAIVQKLLPKLHGSRSKLNKVLSKLIELCEGKYPVSLNKVERMKKNADENGFTSYAEA